MRAVGVMPVFFECHGCLCICVARRLASQMCVAGRWLTGVRGAEASGVGFMGSGPCRRPCVRVCALALHLEHSLIHAVGQDAGKLWSWAI